MTFCHVQRELVDREKNREGTWREGEASDPTVTERLAIALLVLIDRFIPISFFPGA